MARCSTTGKAVVVGASPVVVERFIIVGKLMVVVVGPCTRRSGSATGKVPTTEEADGSAASTLSDQRFVVGLLLGEEGHMRCLRR
jgi:hypothetical protein